MIIFAIVVYALSERYEEFSAHCSFGALKFGVSGKSAPIYLSQEKIDLATS